MKKREKNLQTREKSVIKDWLDASAYIFEKSGKKCKLTVT